MQDHASEVMALSELSTNGLAAVDSTSCTIRPVPVPMASRLGLVVEKASEQWKPIAVDSNSIRLGESSTVACRLMCISSPLTQAE